MWAFIVNPQAGNGRGKLQFEKLQKTLDYQSLQAVYYYSEYEGHAETIAKELAANDEITAIIVVGGDGTIHEVINGIGSKDIPVGFIPGGSGNDFARGAHIKGSPERILKQLTGMAMETYWIGTYQHDELDTRYFVNSVGFGLDAEVGHTANQSFYKKIFNHLRFGTGNYIIALLQVLKYFKPVTMEITLNGKKRVINDCWLISVGNHPYYGGGMKVMPNARIQPDKFSVLLVHSISKWKVLALFLTVFSGMHEKIKGVELLEASSLTIESKEPIYSQVDGETQVCKTAVIRKRRNAIRLIVPK